MRKRHLLNFFLVLLMLIMTACGGYKDAEQETSQGYEAEVQETPSSTDDIPDVLQESDIETQSSVENTPEVSPELESEVQVPTAEPEATQEAATNIKLPEYGNYYYDVTNVVLYLEIYGELPPNYITKSQAQSLGWEGGSVEKYQDGAAIGGDTFGNREGLLPAADGRRYTECDIDTHGYNSRGSRRLIFSNDGLYFYTSDHYESFSEITVTEDYEVIW